MTADEIAKKMDEDRRNREAELLLVLLVLMDQAADESVIFLKHGESVQTVLNNTLLGIGKSTGAVGLITESMAEAHQDSFATVVDLSGEKIDLKESGSIEEIAAAYKESATYAAQAMANTLARAILDLKEASPDLSASDVVTQAFQSVGYSQANPYAIEAGVERQIVSASNGGILAAAKRIPIVEAFVHVSVLDNRTTNICRQRNGLTLDSYDPYWLSNCPPLHFGCRSVLVPLFGPFVASDTLPTIPPDPGFGIAPAGTLAV